MRATRIGTLLAAIGALGASAPDDPLREEHEEGGRGHVMAVFRVDSSIENLNTGAVQVFGTRREYRCPDGVLVSESRCDPCIRQADEWGEQPADRWMYEMAWSSGDEDSHADALARAEHFGRHFELEKRDGSEKPGRRFTFFEYSGKLRPPPEPPKAMRVSLFVAGREATAAQIAAGRTDIEVEARAQKKGSTGGLEDFPEATIAFSAACGTVREAGGRKALFSLAAGVERCELKATAMPGAATAAIGITRETRVEITYEGQAADEIVLDGAEFVLLGVRAEAAGRVAKAVPEWKAEGGAVELVEGGAKVKFRLAKGSERGEVSLLDRSSGAGDRVTVRRAAH